MTDDDLMLLARMREGTDPSDDIPELVALTPLELSAFAKDIRRAALEEACEVIMQPANMSYFWGEVTGADHCAEEIAKQIRALSRPTET